MRKLFVIGALATLFALAPLNARAEDVSLPAPIQVEANISVVNNGAGTQIDPHISGDWVSYSDNSVFGIRIQNLALGPASDRLIPQASGLNDELSDISGRQIVFRRADDGPSQVIYTSQIDDAGDPTVAQAVDPAVGSSRRRSVVGSGTIAWEDRGYDSSNSQPEIGVYDPAAGQTKRLTTDTVSDQWPAVSSDGSAVVWVKCASATACDVWKATRAGNWDPVQVTGLEGEPDGNESVPDTDGGIVVYGSNASGDDDIYYRPIAGGAATHLSMPGNQRNANISGNLISFESNAGPATQFDLMVYDLSTHVLYQITNTPVSENLSDFSAGSGGLVRLVWSQWKVADASDQDVYAASAVLRPPQSQSLEVRPLFDNAHAHRAGSVVPLRLQILNGEGVNISSPDLVLTATGLVKKDNTSVTAVVDDAGNANPDKAFRYDASLQGYVFNLSTKGMTAGTWQGQFQVSGYSGTYTVEFDLR